MFTEIRQAIIDKLNSNDVQNIMEAHRTNQSKFASYPAAVVFPTQSESDYHETAPGSNKETYIFTVRIFYPFIEGQEKADLAIEKSLDELIALFRSRDALGAGVADWIRPVPSVWGYEDRSTGTMRVAELKIEATKHVGIG